MIQNQINIFLIFIVNGLIIGLLFDFFRILRKSFNTKDIVTYIQDILFWILTGTLILYSTFIFNNGDIRLFMVIAIFLGIITYILCLSKYVVKVNVKIIGIVKDGVIKIFNVLLIPINFTIKTFSKIFIKPFSFLIVNIRKVSTNFFIKLEKILKKQKKNINMEGFTKKM